MIVAGVNTTKTMAATAHLVTKEDIMQTMRYAHAVELVAQVLGRVWYRVDGLQGYKDVVGKREVLDKIEELEEELTAGYLDDLISYALGNDSDATGVK